MNPAHRAYNQLPIIVLTGLMLLLCGTSAWGEDAGSATPYMTSADRMADPTPKAWGKTAPTQYGLINDITATYNCGQISSQSDECETGTYEGNLTLTPNLGSSIQPTGPPTFTDRSLNPCSYDADGRLTKDPSRGIANIVYNEIGMPQKVLFNSGAYIGYVYLANGKKVEQKTAPVPLTLGQFPRVVPVTTIYDEAFEISLGTVKRLNVPGGYVTPRDSVFHLNVPDYQGNNVAVINTETGQAEQLTDYYPYGQPINNGLGASVNPYKYGGKELLTANGYNASDFAARWLSHSLPGFQAPDPLAHETPWLSMYAYCGGDPINLIDPTGKASYWFHGTFSWDEQKYFDKQFRRNFESMCGEFTPYKWSGSLFDGDIFNYKGRLAEGIRMGEKIIADITANYIDNGRYTGGKLVIGGHSHGGNIARIASKYVFDKMNKMHREGKLINPPTINLIMINTPTILGMDEYALTPQQAEEINTIQVNAHNDVMAALGRFAATNITLTDNIINKFLNNWIIFRYTASFFTNIFYNDSKTKVNYTDQIHWRAQFPGGFTNHQGNWDENMNMWFNQIKYKIKD